LLNNLGNLFNRILKYAHINFPAPPPPLSLSRYTNLEYSLITDFEALLSKYCKHMEKTEIRASVQTLLEMGQVFNRYLQSTKFWIKDNNQPDKDKDTIAISLRVLEYFVVVIAPFMPTTSAKIIEIMGLHNERIVKF
jgi:methionyl-tRNA synthetase